MRWILATMAAVLCSAGTSEAQWRTYTGTIQVGQDAIPIVMYAPQGTGPALYSGRGLTAGNQFRGPAATIGSLTENPVRGVVQLQLAISRPGVLGADKATYECPLPMSGSMTLTLVSSHIAVPGTVALTPGTAVQRVD